MRKNNVLVYLAFLVFTLSSYTSVSQQIINKVKEIPEKYRSPNERTDYEQSSSVLSGTVWIVFSDRENNQTFTEPGGTTVKKTLSFLEKFYVIGETNEYLQIIKITDVEKTGQLYDDYGWIKKENLVLWTRCLALPNNADKKILITNTLEYITSADFDTTSFRFSSVFKNPALSVKSDLTAELFTDFYVYKITKSAVLVGNKIRFSSDGSDISEIVAGWVPIYRTANWNHQIFIEPNYDKKAAKERNDKKMLSRIFFDKISATLYRKNTTINNQYVVWEQDQLDKRNGGEWYRFPVLNIANDIITVGMLGEITSKRDSLGNIVVNQPQPPSKYVSGLTASVYDYILQLDTNKRNLTQIYTKNYSTYIEGLAPYKQVGSAFPLFKFSKLLSRQELIDLINTKYSDLVNFKSSIVQREEIRANWTKLIKDCSTLNENDIDNLTFEQASKLVFGIANMDNKIGKVKFADILKPTILTKDDYDDYIKKIKKNKEQLNDFLNDDRYEYSIKLNDKVFYWISEEYMP